MQWGDGIPRDGTSRKMREYQIRFCEKLSVKFTGLTRQFPGSTRCPRLRRLTALTRLVTQPSFATKRSTARSS